MVDVLKFIVRGPVGSCLESPNGGPGKREPLPGLTTEPGTIGLLDSGLTRPTAKGFIPGNLILILVPVLQPGSNDAKV